MNLRSASHGSENDGSPTVAERSVDQAVAPRAKPLAARREITPAVAFGRRIASRIVGLASAACGGASAIARSLDCSHTQIARWSDEESGDNMSLGDILASSPKFARTVLTAALARLDDEVPASLVSPQRHALRLAHIAGEIAYAVDEMDADGVRTNDELRAVRKLLSDIQQQAARALRDLEVA